MRCQSCGIQLDEPRAKNAVVTAPRFDGLVMCGGCRDASRLQQQVREMAGLLYEAHPHVAQRVHVPGVGDLLSRMTRAIHAAGGPS